MPGALRGAERHYPAGVPEPIVEHVPREARAALAAAWVHVWVAASDAGGAVDFAGPADPAVVATLVAAELADPLADVLVARDDAGEPAGFVVVRWNAAAIMRHWAWLQRLMVHPALQGHGAGRALVTAAHEHARQAGLRQLRLTARSGHGLEAFYGRLGYREIGVHPGAVAVGGGAYRDEITMLADL